MYTQLEVVPTFRPPVKVTLVDGGVARRHDEPHSTRFENEMTIARGARRWPRHGSCTARRSS